jgi:hypothetical protein
VGRPFQIASLISAALLPKADGQRLVPAEPAKRGNCAVILLTPEKHVWCDDGCEDVFYGVAFAVERIATMSGYCPDRGYFW